jgi:adenylate kinase
MRLILFGPPGSGKGTQADILCERLHLEHISTGDILREAARLGTPQGLRAKPFLESGGLAPDELVNAVVAERFRRDDRPAKFVMDGYPRTVAQARAFDAVLAEVGLDLTAVVSLHVEDEEIIRRVGLRWTCPKPNCKRTYHLESKPPKVPGVCDRDGTPLVQRTDDKPETLRERLKVYHRDTAEVATYYRQKGLLREVSGQGKIEEIYCQVIKVLNVQAGPAC